MKRNNKLSSVLLICILLTIISVGLTVKLSEKKSELTLESWSEHSSYNSSNLIVRGTVYDIQTNATLSNEKLYHVFPALVYLNITKVLWASDDLMGAFGLRQLTNDTWNHQNTIVIAYDVNETIPIAKDQLVESSGCYFTKTTSVYLFKIVINSEIEGSYIKSVSY